MKIGGHSLTTRRPDDLDAQLVASTGCCAREIDTILAGGADRAARALRPWIGASVLPGAQLARAIAADPGAIAAIRALYAAPAEAAK